MVWPSTVSGKQDDRGVLKDKDGFSLIGFHVHVHTHRLWCAWVSPPPGGASDSNPTQMWVGLVPVERGFPHYLYCHTGGRKFSYLLQLVTWSPL